MAEHFLGQLPRVAKEELYEDITCIICHEEFATVAPDSESAEEAVRLPCPGGHTVGLNCISSWLSVDKNRTSCPICRYEFRALTTPFRDSAQQLSSDDGQRLEGWLNQWNHFRSYLECAGGTPRLVQQWEQWFGKWGTTAINVNEEGMARARTARDELFTRTGWSEMPADTEKVLWSETASYIELEPLASAIQTLYFREYYLYLLCQPRIGFHSDLKNGPLPTLNREQEESIFRRLCLIGAFRGVLEGVQSRNERWRILRSQGYVYHESQGIWSAYPY